MTDTKKTVRTLSDLVVALDAEFETHTLDSAVPEIENGKTVGWTLSFDGGMCTFATNDFGVEITPKKGDRVRAYGKGFGYTIRGIAINDVLVRYQTPAEEAQAHEEWRANYKREKEASFAKNRVKYEADIASLPDPLRKRMERFRQNPEFDVDCGPYEVFCCTEAAKVLEALKTPEAIQAFKSMSYGEQKNAIPGLAYDEHSGNTFGGAVALAHAVASGNAV